MSESRGATIAESNAKFLVTVQEMNCRLGALYYLISPVLHTGHEARSEEQCDDLKILIAKAEVHLVLAKEMRDIGSVMVMLLHDSQVTYIRDLFGVMDRWEEELEDAVEHMQDVLKNNCTLTLDGLTL